MLGVEGPEALARALVGSPLSLEAALEHLDRSFASSAPVRLKPAPGPPLVASRRAFSSAPSVRWRSLWGRVAGSLELLAALAVGAGEVRRPERGLEAVLAVPLLERALAALEQRLGLSPRSERLGVGLGRLGGHRLRPRLEKERAQT